MPSIEDILADLSPKKKTQPMWPEPDLLSQQGEGGAGPLGIAGKLAQLGGTVANFIPGGQVVGVPLTIGGSAMEGADQGGISGALKGGVTGGAKMVGGELAGKALGGIGDMIKSPVDTGPMTAFSSSGNPLTVPGIRENPIEVFSSQGGKMTVPASPLTVGGS